jgi:hypothetical protein
MSEDEGFVCVVSSVTNLICWVWWYGLLLSVKPSPIPGRMAATKSLAVIPVIALSLLFLVLAVWSASDVRNDGRYVFMYLLMGMAWCGVASFVPTAMGISFQHDALKLANHSAAGLWSGWVLGAMLAFSGANIGDGPGWWVVAFSGILSTGSLILVYWLLEKLGNTHDAVTIDRDLATGLRMAGVFIGCGAVFGVAVAGDWKSADETVRDFLTRAWPAIGIVLAAIFFNATMKPTPQNPRPSVMSCGLIPMLVLALIGLIWAVVEGASVVGAAA